MDLKAWDAWVRIARDVIIVAVGTFMLVYETVFVANPDAYLIGAGLAALGLPPALRLDFRNSAERRQDQRRRKEDDSDWSGMP